MTNDRTLTRMDPETRRRLEDEMRSLDYRQRLAKRFLIILAIAGALLMLGMIFSTGGRAMRAEGRVEEDSGFRIQDSQPSKP